MSLSNILVPNDYSIYSDTNITNDLFVNNVTQNNALTDILAWDPASKKVFYNTTVTGPGITVSSAPGVTAPIYAALASTPSSAIINGIGTDPNFALLNIAPPTTGGNIIINAGSKVTLSDNTQTLSNKTLAAPLITGLILDQTPSGVPLLVNGSTISKWLNYIDSNSVQAMYNKIFDNGATPGPCTFTSNAPATATSTGVAGQITWDATHIYVCIATNSWIRTTLAAW